MESCWIGSLRSLRLGRDIVKMEKLITTENGNSATILHLGLPDSGKVEGKRRGEGESWKRRVFCTIKTVGKVQ
jgi:hypothetical protein